MKRLKNELSHKKKSKKNPFFNAPASVAQSDEQRNVLKVSNGRKSGANGPEPVSWYHGEALQALRGGGVNMLSAGSGAS